MEKRSNAHSEEHTVSLDKGIEKTTLCISNSKNTKNSVEAASSINWDYFLTET